MDYLYEKLSFTTLSNIASYPSPAVNKYFILLNYVPTNIEIYDTNVCFLRI